jgi:hypothetical protein
MANIRRVNIVHAVAEDRLRPSGRSGVAVSGFATFYTADTGWVKVPPGALDLAELWGGSSGFGNSSQGTTVVRPNVEFYLDQSTTNQPKRVRGFVALNGNFGEMFTFGFFGKRYS